MRQQRRVNARKPIPLSLAALRLREAKLLCESKLTAPIGRPPRKQGRPSSLTERRLREAGGGDHGAMLDMDAEHDARIEAASALAASSDGPDDDSEHEREPREVVRATAAEGKSAAKTKQGSLATSGGRAAPSAPRGEGGKVKRAAERTDSAGSAPPDAKRTRRPAVATDGGDAQQRVKQETKGGGTTAGADGSDSTDEKPSPDGKLADEGSEDSEDELPLQARLQARKPAGNGKAVEGKAVAKGGAKGGCPAVPAVVPAAAPAAREAAAPEVATRQRPDTAATRQKSAKSEASVAGGGGGAAEAAGKEAVGKEAVGRRIEVFWPLDRAWYAAEVVAYRASTGKHKLVYLEDGVTEHLVLGKEEWHYAEGTAYVHAPPAEAGAATPGAEASRPIKQPHVIEPSEEPIPPPSTAPPSAALAASGGGRKPRGRPPLAVATPDAATPAAAAPETGGAIGAGPAVQVGGSVDGSDDGGCSSPSAVAPTGAGMVGGENTVPSPKTPAEERGECARTLGSSLVRRYQEQRRQSQALRRASLTTSMIITPTYWKDEPAAANSTATINPVGSGSVASRGARSKQRHLSTALGDFSGGVSSLLSMNELTGRKKKLIFGKSAIHSWGLYAAEPIEKEDFVVEYLGEYVRNLVAKRREDTYRRLGFDDDYVFRVDDHVLVDATRRGGLARFANHCCEPNCYSRIINAGGKQRITLYSKERIEQGEEITYDYMFDLEEDRNNAIKCCCGAKRCRGFIVRHCQSQPLASRPSDHSPPRPWQRILSLLFRPLSCAQN